MNRSSCFAALWVLTGCGGRAETLTPAPIVQNAVAAAVSPDQSLIAYYSQPSHVSGTLFTGILEVLPLASGSAIRLGDEAFAANFGLSGETLYFFQHPTLDATTSEYTGTLSIWTPKLDAPVTLSSGYVPRS